MSSKSSRKAKKPLDLPLGKAVTPKDVDLSHVRLPIDTSVFGLKHVLTLFETATSEVKSYLAYECDLMYECRVCRTIFRSIANFILHKRKFCRDKYNTSRDPGPSCSENDGVLLIQKDIENANQMIANTETPGKEKSYLNPIIENLLKRQEQKKFVEDIKSQSALNESKHEELKKVGDLTSISLEKIDGSDVAVFQTMEFGPNLGNTEMMKTEVMEIHSIFENDEAVIGSDGKILSMSSKEDDKQILKNDNICTECNTKFSTKKTLIHHIKYKHGENKLIYPCPLCKENLFDAWSVYRHLLKVHRMTSSQIRRYRNQIHNSAIHKKPEDIKEKKKSAKDSNHGNDEENEWLDNMEGDSDLQMCGGCGKHFDRKAALMSHSVMCTKRIAVCNSIKKNSSKRKDSDIKEHEEKDKSSKLTGSAKRKSTNLIKYKPKIDKPSDKMKDVELISEEKEVNTGTLSLVLEENDSDTENCTEWMQNDVQMYDKHEVMSIIGVDSITSVAKSSNENNSSKVPDLNDSPCRGFEKVKPSEYMKRVKIQEFSNTNPFKEEFTNKSKQVNKYEKQEVNDNLKNDKYNEDLYKLSDKEIAQEVLSSPELEGTEEVISIPSDSEAHSDKVEILQLGVAESNALDNSETKITDVSTSSSSLPSNCSSDSESSLEISLKNKLNSDFKLNLGDDPNFQDVSIKPLIKEIIEEDNTDLETEDVADGENIEKCTVPEDNICNGLDEEKITDEDVNSTTHCTKERLNNNYNAEVVENLVYVVEDNASIKINKRKRINSPPQRNVKKNCDLVNQCCDLCESQFNSASELLTHMSNHLSWYRFQCSKCSFMSFNKFDCEKHVKRAHKLPLAQYQGTASKDRCPVAPEQDSQTNVVADMKVNQSVGDEKMEESRSKNGRNTISYVDLTIREDPCDDTDCGNSNEILSESGGIEDLSKQAIMEVILGNGNRIEANKSVSGQTSEWTKSVEALQKEFVNEMDSAMGTSTEGHNSESETEHILVFEVKE